MSEPPPGYCVGCRYCQTQRAKIDKATKVANRVTVGDVRLRPWEYAHYGSKITSIVDWYDGWDVGTHATEKDAKVPSRIIDKRAWVSGFLEGWHDAEHARTWQERVPTA